MLKHWISKLLFIGLLSSSANAEITGVGNFSHIVADIDRSAAFYGEVLGLQVNVAKTDFSNNPAIMQMGNTPGAQSRIATFTIPGSEMGIELIEYTDIVRHPVQTRFQDPGAALVQLRIRDMDSILARLEQSQGVIWTPTGVPVIIGENSSIIFLKDPDGFFVELIEAPAPAGSVDGNVYGASFELIINDTDETARFYEEGLGFSMLVGDNFDDNPALSNTVSALGGGFRRIGTTIPGTSIAMNFLEFHGVTRKPLNTKVQDPGTAFIQLFTDDVPATSAKLLEAGGTMISAGGGPVDMGGGRYIVIIRDPNNLFIELLPAN